MVTPLPLESAPYDNHCHIGCKVRAMEECFIQLVEKQMLISAEYLLVLSALRFLI